MPRDPYPKACLAWVGSHRFAKEEAIAKEEAVANEAVAKEAVAKDAVAKEAVAKEAGQAMSKFSLIRVGL
jgi:hypothetical protein